MKFEWKNKSIILLALLGGFCLWSGDLLLDYRFYYNKKTESLLSFIQTMSLHEIIILILTLIIFFALGLFTYSRVQRLQKAMEELQESVVKRDLLSRELNHRIKNNLLLINSLISLKISQNPDRQSEYQDLYNRVNTVALIHKQLSCADSSHIQFDQYIKELVEEVFNFHFQGDRKKHLNFNVSPVVLDHKIALPIGLIVNELIQNACEHAFIDQEEGIVTVEVSSTATEIGIIVQDNGIGMDSESVGGTKETLGMMIVNSLVRQVSGKLEIEGEAGVRAMLTIPLSIYGKAE